MATPEEEAQYALLREDTNNTADTLPDEKAAAVFAQATTLYGAAGSYAGARVLVLRPQWAKASEQADYSQNEESERLGQIAEAKRKLLEYWEGVLADDTAKAEIPKGARPALFTLAKAGRKAGPLFPDSGFNQSTMRGFSQETSDGH